jgi:hypothetical protein
MSSYARQSVDARVWSKFPVELGSARFHRLATVATLNGAAGRE